MRLGVRTKIFLVSVVVIVLVSTLSGVYLEGRIRIWFENNLELDLLARARTAAELLSRSNADFGFESMDPLADILGKATACRVSIITEDGRVVGDSRLVEAELPTTESHGDRPEFRLALKTGEGTSKRFSHTLSLSMFYVAKRFVSAQGRPAVIRLALPMEQLAVAVQQLRAILVFASVCGLIVALSMALLASYLMTRELRALLKHARGLTGLTPTNAPRSMFASDELGGLAGSFHKLSDELEKTVSALARERNRVEAILENMSEAVLALDGNHRVTLVNKTSLEILGLDEAPNGRALLEVMRSPALHDLVRRARDGEPGSTEFDWHAQESRTLWARATPLPATGGSVLVMRDVTELRRLETVRRDFVANVSHELRTPVSVIRANIETLGEGAIRDPEQAERFLEAAKRNADRLASLVGDLLDISRLEAGQYKLNAQHVNLWQAVERVCDAASVRADAKGVKIINEVDKEAAVWADAVALDQVLLNLVDNAVKYGADDGHVHVRGRRVNDMLRIEVEDDGPGIEAKHRSRIFERFYRVDDGRSRAMGGTGLGLAIVKNLIEAMDGQVGIGKAPRKGAVFWVQLHRNGPPEEVQPSASGTAHDKNGRRAAASLA